MIPAFPRRMLHYLVLLTVTAGLYLPALGRPSLWDIDEGHNAEAAREMLERDNWIVPQFNYQLRVDKPVLLYWLQLAAYQLCGVHEFAARLPSALAAMLAVLLTYELGLLLFDASVALLAGMVLATSLLFCGSAHFANPDATLNACTVLTFLLFWRGQVHGGAGWLFGVGLATALGFLAKGPVAVVLPGAVIGLYLLGSRQLRRLWCWQLPASVLVWVLVALPWFALVGSETKGEFLEGFFLKHNKDRFLAPMEGHAGSVFYHVGSLFLGLLPWSVFLLPTLWHTIREVRATPQSGISARDSSGASCRFLLLWMAVWFVFFTVSRTKLPNYILPLYPAAALLTANFLERWRQGAVEPARWLMPVSFACVGLVGVGLTAGLLIASGVMDVPLRQGHRFPGLEQLAWLGLLPVGGAAAATWYLARQDRRGAIGSVGVAAALLAGSLAMWGAPALDAFKAPRSLVESAGARQLDRDIRIGCFAYYQPSLVFYCQREVTQLIDEREALNFLHAPIPVYLFVPARVWTELEKSAPACPLLARHWCLYRNCEVVVVTNQAGAE
jgi:4-amino-4-deoxy-L-arabinose transferase-like glycosyltransferase